MQKIIYIIGLFLISALNLKAIKLNSRDNISVNLGLTSELTNKVISQMENHMDSFLDLVSSKVVDKLEKDIHNENIADKVLVLLENEAELFDLDSYKGYEHNPVFIQSLFINKLKEKLKGSAFGKKLLDLGTKAKQKLVSLYHKHKDKLKGFLKHMLKGSVLPLALKYLKVWLPKIREQLLKITFKLKAKDREAAQTILNEVYDQVEAKVDAAVAKSERLDNESTIQKLAKEKEELNKIEKQEEKVLNSS